MELSFSFTPRPLHLQSKSPGIHWTGGWVGPKAGLDVVAKRKIPSLPLWIKVKVKVKLSLCFIKYHAMMTYSLLN
jgi:hypothetical protein